MFYRLDYTILVIGWSYCDLPNRKWLMTYLYIRLQKPTATLIANTIAGLLLNDSHNPPLVLVTENRVL